MSLLKNAGKNSLAAIMEWQIKRWRRHATFSVVAVVGSVGKTTTKQAIATVLAQTTRVRWQAGNYNVRLTVPLVVFGHAEPAIYNPFAWLRILVANERLLRQPAPFEVAVLELGTDGPGQLADFAYLQPDIAVVTAIDAEHMEYFKTLDAVAREELTVCDYSTQVIVNADAVAPHYLQGRSVVSYGMADNCDYSFRRSAAGGMGPQTIRIGGQTATINLLGAPGAMAAAAAYAVAVQLGHNPADVAPLLAHLRAVPGRMQLLAGTRGTQLLDDTYNASPVAVTAALDVLYATPAPQRIAILGSMNELGETAPVAHNQVGAYCDATKLSCVVTVGADAERYLAPAARQRGCTVHCFLSPYEAGAFVLQHLEDAAVVLAKGSQNRIFTEEALKPLLADSADATLLVRQSSYWLSRKLRQFPAQR